MKFVSGETSGTSGRADRVFKSERMQPGVTVALATVWLTVAAGVVGAVTPRPLRLSHDQYSPASPSHDGVQQDQAWRDHDLVKDQPLDSWIGSQRSISAEDSPGLPSNAERNFPSEEPVKDVSLSKQNSPTSSWQAWLLNIGGPEFATDKVDYSGMPETLPREVPLSEPDDPFVADDTFQDQGPGSVEIYKLDLSKEKALLSATTPSAELPTRNKSKAPKKVDRSKTKTTEMKSTTSPKSLRRQSNLFEEQRTETPVNRDAFGVGGVPELQVGCEGLAAWSHKTKRSIDTPGKEEANAPAELLNVSSMIVDLDHEPDEVESEEDYEEMDELFKIRKMEELAAKRSKLNRGDIDPVLNAHYLNDRWSDELPVRGDLGETAGSRSRRESSREDHEEADARRKTVSSDDDSRSRGRRLLWLAEANTEGFAGDERKRAKRRIDWGFGENEGVVSSDELQTVNERRRQHEMRRHQDPGKRDQGQRGASAEVDNIRQQYERVLEQRRREEEERLRRMQQGDRRTPSRWQEEEERRRDEMRRRQYEEYRRRTDHVSTPRADDEEARRQQMEERRRQEVARRNEQEHRRRQEEERRRRLQEENARRRSGSPSPASDEETRGKAEERRRQEQEQHRSQQEAQRREEEEERRRASQRDPTRNLSEENRRRLEERRWSERRRQEEERRQQTDRGENEVPANLMRSGHHRVNHMNGLGQHDRDQERRAQEERRREQKLREYIARNRPINLHRTNASRNDDEYRRRAEEERRRHEDELRLQDYMRRKQLLDTSARSNHSIGRELFDERRLIEEARQRSRQPDPGTARRHGPWAPTNIDPRSSLEEVRRRQEARRLEEERRLARERQERYEAAEEERRKELGRRGHEEEARRLQEERRKEVARREQEARREQSRRYEEDRKRLEAARVQAERRRQEMLRERGWGGGPTRQPEATRSPDQDPRFQEHRRIQDSRPVPSYLVRDDARRLAAERQRQQQERTRMEAERRRQEEESRRQQATDKWTQQEIDRLQALPVRARIIVRPGDRSPLFEPRVGFDNDNEIQFSGINPSRKGVQVPNFPAPPTLRPPVKSPGPCIWAVVQCCSSNNNRLISCFESMGCPGISWDSNPCRRSIMQAARGEVMKFYAAVENP